MESFEATLRAQFEPLQYAAYFGALVLLGLLETLMAVAREPAVRRKRWPANFGLTAINLLVLGALPLGSLAAADLAAARGWGLLNQVALPAWIAVAAAFLLRSLTSYAIHVAMHKVPLLWRLHRIHHADTAMDIATAVRFHPLEFVVSIPVVLAATVAFGFPPVAVMLYSLVDAAMAVFSHANAGCRAGSSRPCGFCWSRLPCIASITRPRSRRPTAITARLCPAGIGCSAAIARGRTRRSQTCA